MKITVGRTTLEVTHFSKKSSGGHDPVEITVAHGSVWRNRGTRNETRVRFWLKEVWGVITGTWGEDKDVSVVLPLDEDRGNAPYDRSEGPGLSDTSEMVYEVWSLIDQAEHVFRGLDARLMGDDERELMAADREMGDPNP
jgi:hypothetical protein